MNKKATIGILILALVFILSGCEEMFTFNLFDGLEVVDTQDTVSEVTAMDAADGMEEIDDLLGSDDFIDSLSEDEDATTELLTYLEEIADDPDSTTEEKQTALVLEGEIYTKTTNGDDLVNNVSELLTDTTVFDDIENGDAEATDLINLIIPDSVKDEETGELDETAVTDLLLGFYYANDAYEDLGETLNDDSLNEDINVGDVTQTALVANIIANSIEDIILASGGDPDNETDQEDAATALYEVLATGETPDGLFTEEFNPLEDLSTEGSGINNLLSLSGLESLFGGGEE